MTLTEAIISGVVQGVTEFLPISSSGHLVLLHRYFGLTEPGLFFDICLHAGTLAAILVFFRKDIVSIVIERKAVWIWGILIGTVPAVAVALLFEDRIETFFGEPSKVAYMFIATAIALFLGQFFMSKAASRARDLSLPDAFLVGVAQAFSLLPGVSRSGATISAGLIRGLKTDTAFRFSFLLSIPAVAGAVLYKIIKRMLQGDVFSGDPMNFAAGTSVAFIVGLASLPLLLRVMRTRRLYLFGIYCLVLGVSGIFLWK